MHLLVTVVVHSHPYRNSNASSLYQIPIVMRMYARVLWLALLVNSGKRCHLRFSQNLYSYAAHFVLAIAGRYVRSVGGMAGWPSALETQPKGPGDWPWGPAAAGCGIGIGAVPSGSCLAPRGRYPKHTAGPIGVARRTVHCGHGAESRPQRACAGGRCACRDVGVWGCGQLTGQRVATARGFNRRAPQADMWI